MDTRKRVHITVIDSGVKPHTFPERLVSGFGIRCIDGQYQRISDFTDLIGHGTAVVDELLKEGPEFGRITCIRIYETSMETDTEALLFALREIERDIACDMVLISSGVTFLEKYQEMEELIRKISEKGVTVISALDNEGAISFPAAFSEVIGVGITQNDEEIPCAIPGGPVNLVLPNRFYRLQWVLPPQVIVQGSSFGAAQVAALWAKILTVNRTVSRKEIYRQLAGELHLKWVEPENNVEFSWMRGQKFVKGINRAIVFPWNKEVHSLARFQELLPFSIEGFYDLKYNLHLGKDIGELLNIKKSLGIIKNYDCIDWGGDFDTVICGHCTALSQLSKRDLVHEIMDKCKKYKKRLYAFDQEFSVMSEDCFVPNISIHDRCMLPGGRLYNRLTPVVGVVGTSSAQGKFTVQMELRRRFLDQGYTVGQIASEPSGYLFGCDSVFPFGYHGSVSVDSMESLAILNRMAWEASDCNCKEVVIAGSQSGVVPYSHHNMAQYNFGTYDFLCGVNPDIFILCVNPHDPIDYIQRSIHYLYSFNGMPVAALALFPIVYEAGSQLGYGYKKRLLTEEEQRVYCDRLSEETGIPTVTLGKAGLDEIFERVIEGLSELT